jgi:hypothetical protein
MTPLSIWAATLTLMLPATVAGIWLFQRSLPNFNSPIANDADDDASDELFPEGDQAEEEYLPESCFSELSSGEIDNILRFEHPPW